MAARVIAVILALFGVLIALCTAIVVVRLILLMREHGIELSTTIGVWSWHMTMLWFFVLCAGVFVVGFGLIGGGVWFWTMPARR